jgi:hypothetical protein
VTPEASAWLRDRLGIEPDPDVLGGWRERVHKPTDPQPVPPEPIGPIPEIFSHEWLALRFSADTNGWR